MTVELDNFHVAVGRLLSALAENEEMWHDTPEAVAEAAKTVVGAFEEMFPEMPPGWPEW